MKVYVSNRQTGKTTKLIRESAKTGAIIATNSCHTAAYIKYLAKQIGLTIPDPVTYQAMIKDCMKKKTKRYLIDELHMMLWQLGVGIATLDSGHAKLMDFEMNNEED